MATAIEFNNISKIYRLGLVSTGTLAHDLKRWWTMNIQGKEDPYLTIGETNDRSTKGESDYVWALRDINFKVEQGDVVGIIGKNGAGKSTLLKILSKVTAPTTGTIRARGRIGSLLEVGTGFHPEMTGRENIYMNGAILGMTKAEITKKLDEIIDFSGCERYIDTPVKRYSSGMMVRLGFAVAAHLDPEILVVDEVLAVGDAEFQKKAIGKMQDVSHGEGRTVLFVSHNMAAVKNLCKTGVLLENGRTKYIGSIEETINKYLVNTANIDNIPIIDRKDKIGNKKIEVVGLALKNQDGETVSELFTGQELNIEFSIQKNANVAIFDIILACSFSDEYGNPAVLWVSDEIDHSFQNSHLIKLHIPHLTLRPNTYCFNYQISLKTTAPTDFCDVLTNAATITILGDTSFSGEKIVYRQGFGSLIPAKFVQ